jgi:hypothetical protein
MIASEARRRGGLDTCSGGAGHFALHKVLARMLLAGQIAGYRRSVEMPPLADLSLIY